MNEKVFKVFKGYSELDYSERKEVRELIQKFDSTDFDKRGTLIKGLNESLGPLDNSNCPCCGK